MIKPINTVDHDVRRMNGVPCLRQRPWSDPGRSDIISRPFGGVSAVVHVPLQQTTPAAQTMAQPVYLNVTGMDNHSFQPCWTKPQAAVIGTSKASTKIRAY